MDVLFHLLLPFLLLLLFGIKLNRKQALFLAFFSILPDFDRLVFKSRQGFHSLFFIATVLIVLFLLLRKKKQGLMLVGLAALGIFSHILFDLGAPLSLLYPFDTTFYTINLQLQIVKFFPKLFFSIETAASIVQGYGILLSERGFAVLLLLIALLVVEKTKKK